MTRDLVGDLYPDFLYLIRRADESGLQAIEAIAGAVQLRALDGWRLWSQLTAALQQRRQELMHVEHSPNH